MSTICIVGLGYIGLPVASMLASRGHNVVGYDVNSVAVDSVNKGQAHFFEPDLDMLLKAAVNTGKLKASTTPVEADYYVIAVPTPFRANHQPDLSYVDAATQSIAPFLKAGSTVVLEFHLAGWHDRTHCRATRRHAPRPEIPGLQGHTRRL